MKNKTNLIIHCSCSELKYISNISFEDYLIKLINFLSKENKQVQYCILIWIDGRTAVWTEGLNYEIADFKLANFKDITYGAEGYNENSIHVCYIGGRYGNSCMDTRTPLQKDVLMNICKYAKDTLGIKNIQGAYELMRVDSKNRLTKEVVTGVSPCFNVATIREVL